MKILSKPVKHSLVRGACCFTYGLSRLTNFHRYLGKGPFGPFVLCYHRVNQGLPEDCSWESRITPMRFRNHLRFLKRHFHPMSLGELVRCKDSGAEVPPNAVAITFDDGYRDIYTQAFPILREEGVSATLFLVTDWIGKPGLPWWDRAAYSVFHSPRLSVELPEGLGGTFTMRSKGERSLFLNHLYKMLWRYPEREEILNPLLDRLDVSPENLPQGRFTLSWEELREMTSHPGGGIEVGFHTSGHEPLGEASGEGIEIVARGAREEMERQLGVRVEAFSTPYFTPCGGEALDAFIRAGFRVICTTGGINQGSGLDLLDVKRIPTFNDSVPVLLSRMKGFLGRQEPRNGW